jgi:hypothetical protein
VRDSYRQLCATLSDPRYSHVDTFSATYCGLDDDFANEFGIMLANNRTLIEVNLESNNITGPGFIALANALRVNTTLTTLRLRNQRVNIITSHDCQWPGNNNVLMVQSLP